MSVRRWIVIAGAVVAVAGGAVGTGRVGSGSTYEAQAFLHLEGSQSRHLPDQLRDERERFVESQAVRDLVRMRLGETPPVWASAAADATIVVRSRGATPEQATKATETYAASYADARRAQTETAVSEATEDILRTTDQIRSQPVAAEEPQRASLVEQLGFFNSRLDMLQGDRHGPGVVGVTPGEPIHDWSWGAMFVAGLGATTSAGAALSALGTGRGHHAVIRDS
jgi:hypothetical protein